MHKHEPYNEVPLKQFLEFIIESQCSFPVRDIELFLIACNKVCVIDVVRDVESEQPNNNTTVDVVTIKLKNSVLKELIVKSRGDQKMSHEPPAYSKSNPQATAG